MIIVFQKNRRARDHCSCICSRFFSFVLLWARTQHPVTLCPKTRISVVLGKQQQQQSWLLITNHLQVNWVRKKQRQDKLREHLERFVVKNQSNSIRYVLWDSHVDAFLQLKGKMPEKLQRLQRPISRRQPEKSDQIFWPFFSSLLWHFQVSCFLPLWDFHCFRLSGFAFFLHLMRLHLAYTEASPTHWQQQILTSEEDASRDFCCACWEYRPSKWARGLCCSSQTWRRNLQKCENAGVNGN